MTQTITEDKTQLSGIVSYGLNYHKNYTYKQCLRINSKTFELVKKKIAEKIAIGLEYGNYLEMPVVFKNNDICFSGLNLSTAKFIRELMDKKTKKRFLMDRNTLLVVDLTR